MVGFWTREGDVADSDSFAATANEIDGGTANNWRLEVQVMCLDL